MSTTPAPKATSPSDSRHYTMTFWLLIMFGAFFVLCLLGMRHTEQTTANPLVSAQQLKLQQARMLNAPYQWRQGTNLPQATMVVLPIGYDGSNGQAQRIDVPVPAALQSEPKLQQGSLLQLGWDESSAKPVLRAIYDAAGQQLVGDEALQSSRSTVIQSENRTANGLLYAALVSFLLAAVIQLKKRAARRRSEGGNTATPVTPADAGMPTASAS